MFQATPTSPDTSAGGLSDWITGTIAGAVAIVVLLVVIPLLLFIVYVIKRRRTLSPHTEKEGERPQQDIADELMDNPIYMTKADTVTMNTTNERNWYDTTSDPDPLYANTDKEQTKNHVSAMTANISLEHECNGSATLSEESDHLYATVPWHHSEF